MREYADVVRKLFNEGRLFLCRGCGEHFDAKVWHCKKCDHHWPMHRDQCLNCHRQGRVGCFVTEKVTDLAILENIHGDH